jgi:hypothetical protein
MPDTELDITSLLARISQLEERQNIVSKYMVGLKRQFDGMTEALQQIEPLREQVSELQQRFDQLPTLSNSLDDAETPNGAAESVSVDDAETVKQFFERVEQQQRQESPASTESVVHPAEVEVNAETAETDKDEETVVQT